ncbi:unnamed protein product [Amoebophrya sp. A25]|nr:unnamed protein product [Amoebophrya sp. A25]|eukprot:GSA25T00014428001.1
MTLASSSTPAQQSSSSTVVLTAAASYPEDEEPPHLMRLDRSQVATFMHEICEPGFGSYTALFRRLTLHYLLFWGFTVLIPFIVMDNHSCGTTEYLGLVSHLIFLVLLCGSLLEEVDCALLLLKSKGGGGKASLDYTGSDAGDATIFEARRGGGGRYAGLDEDINDFDADIENSGTAVSSSCSRICTCSTTGATTILSKTQFKLKKLKDYTRKADEAEYLRATEMPQRGLAGTTPTTTSKTSTSGAGSSKPTVIGSQSHLEMMQMGEVKWKESPKGNSTDHVVISSTSSTSTGTASGTIAGSSASSSSSSSRPPLSQQGESTSSTSSTPAPQMITKYLIRLRKFQHCCLGFCHDVFFESLVFYHKEYENLYLLARTAVWRIDVYLDLIFIIVARNCGSNLWWPSLAVFVSVNFLLQIFLHLLFAFTDCDGQLPRCMGFVLFDFGLVNKAVRLRLPFNYDSIAAGIGGPGSGMLTPQKVSHCIMVEKCFLGDVGQILIQTKFLLDVTTPNNGFVYLSVFCSYLSLLLNLLQLVTVFLLQYREAQRAAQRLHAQVRELNCYEETSIGATSNAKMEMDKSISSSSQVLQIVETSSAEDDGIIPGSFIEVEEQNMAAGGGGAANAIPGRVPDLLSC